MKKVLIGITIVVVVLIVAAVAAPFFISTDTYKAKLISAVKESTGRDLRIDGPVSFQILPSLALSASQVSFSNAAGAAKPHMAEIKSFEVKLRWLPLLSGTVAIDSFVMTDPVISLEVDKAGKPNWVFGANAPAGAKPAAAPPPQATKSASGGAMSELARLRLGGLKIENGTVSYLDQRTSKRYDLSAINLAVSMSDIDSPLSVKGAVTWNGEKVNLDLGVDRPSAFEGGKPSPIKLSVSSTPINISFSGSGSGAPQLKVNGDVSLNIASVRNLAKWAGEPMVAGNGFGPFSIKGKLDVAGDKYGFGDADIAFDNIKGKGGVTFDNGGAKPYIKASLALDTLDLNPYMAGAPKQGTGTAPSSPASTGAKPASSAQGWSTDPIDVSPLKLVDADFQLGANKLLYEKIQVDKSALNLHLKDAHLTADLTELNLYKGSGTGKVTVDGSGAVPAITQAFNLKNVDMQPLLRDAANVSLLSGIGSLDISTEGKGRSQRDIISSLGGKGSIHLDKGALKGVNVVGMMKSAANALTAGLVGGGQETEFTTASGTFTITNGILKNTDLQMTSSELPMTGQGTVDLPQRRVDYRLTPKIAGAVAVPIAITGPWDDLSYKPDVGAMLSNPGNLLKALPGVGGNSNSGSGSSGGGVGGALKGLFGK